MSTYIELCKDMARDVGIPGIGPLSVTPTPEEEKDVVRYIKDADLDIQPVSYTHLPLPPIYSV